MKELTIGGTLRIAGAILAGGNARRLGGLAKGAIDVGNGACIVERLTEELAKTGVSDIVALANDSRPYQNCRITIIPDVVVGCGPIGGIATGLAHFTGRSDAVMFVPCDMPNITATELSALKEAFVQTGASVVFAETKGFFGHPLCAVVHNDLQREICSAIEQGERKVGDIWRRLKGVTVQFAADEAFFNINEHTDLDRWRKGENEKANVR